MNEFDFKKEPGKKKFNNRDYVENAPLISVIVPFYNSYILLHLVQLCYLF